MPDHLPSPRWREQRRQFQRRSRTEGWAANGGRHRVRLAEAIRVTSGYHASRLTADPRRTVLWRTLWQYHFRWFVDPQDCVLDLGSGYGAFINEVVARRRI